MDGAMLRIDRQDLCPRGQPRFLDDRAGRDQRLLVGQGQPPARFQGGQCDRQACETHDPVEDDVGVLGDSGERARAGQHFGARGDQGRQLLGAGLVGHGHTLRSYGVGLLGQHAH